jgi:hypothetical protein
LDRIFDGLSRLAGDVVPDVRHAAQVLDRLFLDLKISENSTKINNIWWFYDVLCGFAFFPHQLCHNMSHLSKLHES